MRRGHPSNATTASPFAPASRANNFNQYPASPYQGNLAQTGVAGTPQQPTLSYTYPGQQPLPSQQAVSGYDAAYLAYQSQYSSARSRARYHRLATRLNSLEWLIVSVLQWFSLWPALLQPPQTETMVKEMEATTHQHQSLLQTSANANADSTNSSADASTSTSANRLGSIRWSSSLLESARRYVYPNAWMPLSFRKTVLIEPTLEPQPPAPSTTNQWHLTFLLLIVIFIANTIWMR